MLENEYDSIADDLEGAQKSQLKSADFATKETNPDQKAEAFKLSQQYKVPVEFVESNFEEFKKKNTDVREDIYDELATNYKATSKFLSDANNAGVAKDDIDSLKKIEDISKRSFSENLGNSFLRGMSKMNESIANIPAATYDIAAYPLNKAFELAGKEYRVKSSDIGFLKSGFGVKDYYKKTSEYYSNQVPELSQSILDTASKGDYKKAGEILAYNVAASSPNQLFIIGSALMGRPDLGLSSVGVTATSSNIQDVIESGKDPVTGVPAAIAKGGLEVATESLGTLKFIEDWGGSLSKVVAKEGYKEIMKSFAKTIAAGMATEATEEAVNSFAADFVDYSTGENVGGFEGSFKRAIESGLIGGVSGGVMTGPTAAMVGVQKSIEVKQAEIDKQMYLDMQEGVLNSKLYKRLPEKMAEHINEAVKDSPIENIYISKDAFTQYFQSKNLDPAEEAAKLGLTAEFDKASETGSDIVLPTGAWVSKVVGTEHYAGLQDDVRFSPDMQSVREAKEEQKALKEAIKAETEAAQKADAEGKEIIDDVYNQLVESGTPKNVAKSQAQIYRALNVLAQRAGKSPLELYKKYGLKIVSSQESGSYFPETNPSGPNYSLNKDENGMYQYDSTILEMMRTAVAQGEAGGIVLPDGRRSQSTFPEFFKNKGLKKKDVLKIIEKYNRGEMLSEGQKETLNMMYADAVDAVNRGQSYFQTRSPIGFYSQLEAEIEKMDFAQMPAKDLANRIKNIQGLKKEELDFTGILDFLNAYEGKISKDQVIEYVKNKGLKVEQIILGNSDMASEQFDFTEAKFIPLSEYDRDYYWDAVNDEISNKMYDARNGDDNYFEDTFFPDFKEKNLQDYTDEDGSVDEETIKEAALDSYEESIKKDTEEYVDSEDYFNAKYRIMDKNSGYSVEGSSDSGWYSSDTGKNYDGNEEEVKIQFAADLIAQGLVDGKISDLITDKNIKWSQPNFVKSPTDQTIKKRAQTILKEQKSEVRERSESQNSYLRDEPEQFQKEVEKDMDSIAYEMAKQYYKDPENPKNTVSISIDSEIVDAKIIGNSKKGWTLEFESDQENNRRNILKYKTIELKSKNTEEAKAEAIQELVKKGLVSKAKEGDKEDVNKITGTAKFRKYSVIGGENYREVLLTLPQIGPDKFKYTPHFNEENFVAHARISDAEVGGKKVLFIEEIQSDWHQQGREKGYLPKNASEEIKKLKQELQKAEEEYQKIDVSKMKLSEVSETKEAKLVVQLREKIAEIENAVPDAPLKQTEAWTGLVIKRLINMAVEQGYDKVAWTPASVHVERWGTDFVSWVKKDPVDVSKLSIRENRDGTYDIIGENGKTELYMQIASKEEALKLIEKESKQHFLVGSAEQRGGFADGMNIEEVARERGKLLERSGERVETKEELRKVIADTLSRERNDRSLDSITDRVWKQMESGDPTGSIAPRKEGMQFFYDKLVPDVVKKLLSKTDKEAKIEVLNMDDYNNGDEGFEGKALSFDLTDKIKNVAKEQGFTLFQEARGSITFGLNDQTVINLFKEKNQSTFLHESGHYFLKVFQDLATDPNATESIKADGAEILKYLGVSSWDQVQTEQHEKWARSFEAYLMKGEAPTPMLQKAFNTFKTWLISIYKKVSALNVELTPEIIGVMDRMIAIEEEINEAQVQSGLTNLFKDPIAAGMNEKDAQKYKEAIEGAQVFAEAKLMSKLMEELNKKQSKLYREKYDQYRSEAFKELTKRKIYDVISILKTGKHISGAEAFPPFKLDKQSVINQFGKEMADLMPKKIFGKDGTELDIAVLADSFGYQSAAELAQELVETAPIDDVSRQMASERIKVEFPELYKEPEIKGEALMALHNEKRGEMLKFELDFLQKNYPTIFKDAIRRTVKRSPVDQQVRAEAQKIVGSMNVKDLKPYLYLRAEANASKEAGVKLAKGDIKGAFEAKRREYLNYEIYRATVDAKSDVEKSVKDFKKFFEKTEDMAKKRDPDLINAAKAVLEKFGLSREAAGSPFEYLKKIKEYDPQAYEPIEAIVSSAIEGAQNYTSVSYDKFSEMRDVVLTLWDMSKNVKQMQIDGQSVEIETVKNDLSAQLDKHITEATPAIKQELTDKEKFKTKLLNAFASLRRVESWSDLMDLGTAGPFKKYIWNPVSEAITEYRLAKKPVMKKYKEILKKYEDVFTRETIIAEGLNGFVFKDKSRLLMAMLHTGNDSNKQKLLRGWGWGTVDENGVLDSTQFDAQIAQFQQDGVLTKRDYDMLQEIWDLMESLKPGAQRAHKKMFGYYFNEITAREIQTPYGSYRGGYIPAKVDVFTNEDAQIRKEREEFEQGNNSFQFPTTGRGFTKSRVEAYAAPLALDMNLLGNHIDGVLRFTHIEPTVKQTARIVNNKEFRAKLKDVDPAAGSEILVPWLQRSALQKVTTPSDSGVGRLIDSAATKLRSGIAMQFMVGNFTNAMQQVTGIAVAASKVKPKHLLFATKEYLTNRKEILKLISDKSKWMGTVQDQTLYETQEAVNQILTNPSVFENIQSFAKAHTYFLQSATQNFVNTVVWTGAYNEAVESGLTEVEAVRAADGAVRQTQGTNNPEDVSRFEVGTPTYRLFTQFAGYFNMLTNLQTTEFQKIMKELGLKKGAGKLAYLYFMAVMIPAVGSQLIVQLMSGKDFDEDDDGIANDLMALFFGSQFKTATAQVPFVGPIATSAYNRFNKQAYDDRLSFSPVISVLEAGAGVPYSIYKDASKEEIKKRTVKDFLNIAGVFSGLPLGPVGRPVGYLMDVNSGDANPSGPVDYTRGLISGQKGQ